MAKAGTIRIGIGGWTYAPWRGTFYPDDLAQKRELEYAANRLTSIEINGTYYGAQKPATFAKWHDETPEDFVFSLKAPRFATNRRVLAEVDSTMAEATRMAPTLAGPVWVCALRQTAARGRRGRAWISPEGNFAATLALPVTEAPGTVALRSFVAALALFDAVVALTGRADGPARGPGGAG